MDTQTLANYISAAFESVPFVYKVSHSVKVGGFAFDGWNYYPPTMLENDEWASPHVSEAHPYSLSRPKVTVLQPPESGFRVVFEFGVVDPAATSVYAVVSINLDPDGKPAPNGKITVYKNKDADPLTDLPIPGHIPLLPEPVSFVLWSWEYANEVNDWVIEQGLDDLIGRQLALGSFLQLFCSQVQAAISLAFANVPSAVLDYAQGVAKPFRKAIRQWPGAEWRRLDDSPREGHGPKAGDTAYFNYNYNGEKLRCWMPTFVVGPYVWAAVLKFDMVKSFSKDDHVVMYVMGNFEADNATLGNVLAVSAVTDYRHSDGEDLTVAVSTNDGSDVENTWLTEWSAENATEKSEVEIFSQGVAYLFQQFITQLRSVTDSRISHTYDVSAGGKNDVSLWVNSEGQVFAGCAGRVFQIDPASNGSIPHQINLPVVGNTDVSLVSTEDVLYAGADGLVWALSMPSLKMNWGGNGYCDLTKYTGSNYITLFSVSERIFAAGGGWVLEITPYNKRNSQPKILWQYQLSSLSKNFGASVVTLAWRGGVLYCGSNGYVAALDVSGSKPVPRAPAGNNSYYKLPNGGNHPTTLGWAPVPQHYVYAGCNGYVYQLDADSYNCNWTTELSSINSDFGNHPVFLAAPLGDDQSLLAGSNGRVVRLNIADGSNIPDKTDKATYKLQDGGKGTTVVISDGRDAGGLASCMGWVYRLNPFYYSTNSMPDTQSTLSYKLSLNGTGTVSLTLLGDIVFAGMQGFVQAVSLLEWPGFPNQQKENTETA